MKTETDVKFQVSVGNMDEYCISSIKDKTIIPLSFIKTKKNYNTLTHPCKKL